MPLCACSRHPSQKASTCRCPVPVEPCHIFFSGLGGGNGEGGVISLFYFQIIQSDAALFGSPSVVAEDVFAVKRVDRHAVFHPALVKDGVPAVEQDLVLMEGKHKPLTNLQDVSTLSQHAAILAPFSSYAKAKLKVIRLLFQPGFMLIF